MGQITQTDHEYFILGLASWHGHPSRYERFHRHNEVELGLIEEGWMCYLFGSGRITLQAGQFAVFWGGVPHQLVSVPKQTVAHWLTIPLAWFLQWQFPRELTRQILRGRVVSDPKASDPNEDLALFHRWHHDLKANSEERRKIVLLEAEARLRRLGLSAVSPRTRQPTRNQSDAASGHQGTGNVEKIAAFIAENYTKPLRVREIAQAAGLHPEYAVRLFRKTCGMSLVDYVTEHRVSHAQRLLATTDAKIVDIAFASGFSSASRFYAAFEKACGKSPKNYQAFTRIGLNPLNP